MFKKVDIFLLSNGASFVRGRLTCFNKCVKVRWRFRKGGKVEKKEGFYPPDTEEPQFSYKELRNSLLRLCNHCFRQVSRYKSVRNKRKYVRYLRQLEGDLRRAVSLLEDYEKNPPTQSLPSSLTDDFLEILKRVFFTPNNFESIKRAIDGFVHFFTSNGNHEELCMHLKGSAALLGKLHKFYKIQTQLKIWTRQG